MKVLELRTPDHPQANGRKAIPGETAYPLSFPLEDGSRLILHTGQKGFDTLTNLLIDMLSEAPSHDDGTITAPPHSHIERAAASLMALLREGSAPWNSPPGQGDEWPIAIVTDNTEDARRVAEAMTELQTALKDAGLL